MDPADDDHLSPQQQLDISKKMFIGGFFFLPWLWLVNFWYGWEYFNKPDTPSQVKFYTRASLAGFILWCIAIIIWLSVYLTQRESWGAKGDTISITIPNGA
eukprot:CAMPEP_0168558706 /NCGR_PEP_ID=MMETSP0413-20121227/10118_1 /TAXON_ID=136452 /ORGANISM="Filamoeba nolandi, Strain NC-AS-23-1" /LENGTH=100 /DNA_ID=CAMNT_0008589855 /DNA_START=17 /DNA_END=319 /DNA_ORIENTATION=-